MLVKCLVDLLKACLDVGEVVVPLLDLVVLLCLERIDLVNGLVDSSKLVVDGLQDLKQLLVLVEEALRRASRNTSAGFRVAGGQEYLIQGVGQIRTISDIEQTVVAARGTQPILVSDLGTVRIGEALKRGEGSYNGEPAVVLGIQIGALCRELSGILRGALCRPGPAPSAPRRPADVLILFSKR